MNFKEKLVKYFVERFWNCDIFQETISEKINAAPIEFTWRNFDRLYSKVGDYIVIHSSNQMVPWLFTSEKEVREKVAEWDEILANYTKSEEKPVKPKRKYTKRKKDGDTGKKNS